MTEAAPEAPAPAPAETTEVPVEVPAKEVETVEVADPEVP